MKMVPRSYTALGTRWRRQVCMKVAKTGCGNGKVWLITKWSILSLYYSILSCFVYALQSLNCLANSWLVAATHIHASVDCRFYNLTTLWRCVHTEWTQHDGIQSQWEDTRWKFCLNTPLHSAEILMPMQLPPPPHPSSYVLNVWYC